MMRRVLLVLVLVLPMAVGAMDERERFELLRMWKLVDALELDEAQAARFFPVWSRNQRLRREAYEERRDVAGKLESLLDQKAAPEQIRAHMEQVRAQDRRLQQINEAMQKELERVLSASQQARLMLFEDHFRQDLRDFVREFRGFHHKRENSGEKHRDD